MKSIFSKNLVRLRQDNGWTQDEAAQLIGIKRPTLGAYEEGRAEPCLNILYDICQAYSITDIRSFLYNKDFLLLHHSNKSEELHNLSTNLMRLKHAVNNAKEILETIN